LWKQGDLIGKNIWWWVVAEKTMRKEQESKEKKKRVEKRIPIQKNRS